MHEFLNISNICDSWRWHRDGISSVSNIRWERAHRRPHEYTYIPIGKTIRELIITNIVSSVCVLFLNCMLKKLCNSWATRSARKCVQKAFILRYIHWNEGYEGCCSSCWRCQRCYGWLFSFSWVPSWEVCCMRRMHGSCWSHRASWRERWFHMQAVLYFRTRTYGVYNHPSSCSFLLCFHIHSFALLLKFTHSIYPPFTVSWSSREACSYSPEVQGA
jgi:hypothetical protein